jgi:transcriptional regulator with XRE-family HTH domain
MSQPKGGSVSDYRHADEREYLARKIHPRPRQVTYTAADIRRLMKQRGLNQSDLAKVLGVSQVAVSRWARGAMRPNLVNITMLKELEQETLGFQLMDSADAIALIHSVTLWLKSQTNARQLIPMLEKLADSYALAYLRLQRLGMTGDDNHA